MKKSSLLVLFAAIGMLAGCSKSETLYFGFGDKTAYSLKTGYVEADTTIGGFIFDKDGKVVKAYIDVMQVKIESLDGTATIKSGTAVNSGTDVKSKRELGDAYGMGSTAAKGEWYVQADAWQAFAVGKTAEELVAANGSDALLATVTIHTVDFESVVAEAWANKVEFKGVVADLKLGIGMLNALGATASAMATDTVTVIGAVFDKDGKVVVARIDAFQPPVIITTTGEGEEATYSIAFNTAKTQVDSENSVIKSKRDLGDAYGMGSTATKGEWYVQADAWQAFAVGKTAEELVAANGSDALLATVTIHTADFETIVTEAYAVII